MKTLKQHVGSFLLVSALVFAGSASARAEVIGGVDFPMGDLSFADSVVSFDLHDSAGVMAPYNDPTRALGRPDFVSADVPNFVALGNAPADGITSELVLRFDNNALVDIPGDDLFIFEAGAAVESTTVDISVDGVTYFSLGRITGSTRGIDIADFPSVPKLAFRYVRLRDFPDGVTSFPPFAGPDIDAVGAIGSIVVIPPDTAPEAGPEPGPEPAVEAPPELPIDAAVRPDVAPDVSPDQKPSVDLAFESVPPSPDMATVDAKAADAASPDAAPIVDAGATDAASADAAPIVDAAALADAATAKDAPATGSDGGAPAEVGGGGCSCSLRGDQGTLLSPAAGLVLVAALLLRRRRR